MLEGNGGAAGTVLRAVLCVPGKLYGCAMRARRRLYEKGIFSPAAAEVPVISVGNITAGGSGKTPLVVLLANHFAEAGKKPAILLRGYRSAAGNGSDEANLYKKLCPAALVETGSDRVASAKRAVAAGANIILMDDGFQHLRLRRNLDIVLIDATAPWGGGNTIPGGLLREPLSALSRAQVIIITRADQAKASDLSATRKRIQTLAPKALLLTARHKPARLRHINAKANETSLPPESLRGKRVVILSGIARPEAFARTLASLGAEVVDSFTGNDHRHFPEEFQEKARTRAADLNASLVTTEKDEAKGLSVSALVLGVEQDIDGADKLFGIIDKTVG